MGTYHNHEATTFENITADSASHRAWKNHGWEKGLQNGAMQIIRELQGTPASRVCISQGRREGLML